MCGIAAEILRNPSDKMKAEESMRNVLLLLAHRGPDSSGIWSNENVVLGHRRLSIIDLSEAGNQPFHDSSGILHLVFNGEIYNYKELRMHYEQKGWTFKSNCDTEVILAGYSIEGETFVSKLRGMFAFLLYDQSNQVVYLGRDRIGKKPCYYSLAPDRLRVSSELKAFSGFSDFSPTISTEALHSYFSFQYIRGPGTIYNEVQRLEPGTLAKLDLHTWQWTQKSYWSLKDALNNRTEFRAKSLEELIEQSVRYRLIADVEVGLLLSGGIDSSILSLVAAKVSDKKPRAFFVSFQDASLDETRYATEVAQALDLKLHVISGETPDFNTIERAIYHADEPLGDPAIVPTFQISEALSKHVKVVLSGEGADEFFWGYPHYQREKYYRLLGPLVHILKWLSSPFRGPARHGDKLRKFARAFHEPAVLGSSRWTRLFNSSEISLLLTNPEETGKAEKSMLRSFKTAFSAGEQCNLKRIEKSVFNELVYWLPDDLLIKVDRMTMAHSVEARAPFLDQDLIVKALSLNVNEKISLRKTKIALRKYLKKHMGKRLTGDLIKRRKHGFEVPLKKWLCEDYTSQISALFTDENLIKYPFLNAGEFQRMWMEYKERYRDSALESKRIWLLVSLLLWLGQSAGAGKKMGKPN
jgi:asparagine synthase (glutamine-hydrolysing)